MKGRFLTGVAAVAIAAGLAFTIANAGQVPLINTATTAVEPANLAAHLNALTARVNANIGQLTFLGNQFSSAASLSEQTVASYTLPAATPIGAVLHQRCWGTRLNNGNVVTAKLYFGSESASLVVVASATTNWDMESFTLIYSNATNSSLFRSTNTGVATAIAESQGTESVSGGAIVMKCTVTDGAASAGDAVVNGYYVDIIH